MIEGSTRVSSGMTVKQLAARGGGGGKGATGALHSARRARPLCLLARVQCL
jgi:hypothetical protein